MTLCRWQDVRKTVTNLGFPLSHSVCVCLFVYVPPPHSFLPPPPPPSNCFHIIYRETVSVPSPCFRMFSHNISGDCVCPLPLLPNVFTEDIGRLCLPRPLLLPNVFTEYIWRLCLPPPPPPPPALPNVFTEDIRRLCLSPPPASESFHRRYREAVHLIPDGLDPKLSPNEDRCEQMCPPTQTAYIWCRISLQPATLS